MFSLSVIQRKAIWRTKIARWIVLNISPKALANSRTKFMNFFHFYKFIFPVVVKSSKVVSIDLIWVFSCLFYYNGVYKRPNWIPPPIQFLFFCSLAHRFLCSVVKKIFDREKELTQNVFAHRCYFRAKREREIKIVVPPKEMHQKTEKTTWHNIKYN